VSTQAVKEHVIDGKSIPSNFFGQAGTEKISAVMFTNSGTLGKFDRMGYAHGYGNDSWLLTRSGFSFERHPDAMDPTLFLYDVGQPPLVESWGQGLVVCHNPQALHPLPRDYFVDAVQQHVEKGVCVSDHWGWHPISSKTTCAHLGELKEKIPEMLFVRPAIAVGAITKREFQEISGINHDDNPLLEEHGWFSDESTSFLGAVVFDRLDKDWGFVILARDRRFVFCEIEVQSSMPSRHEARMQLQIHIAGLLRKAKRIFSQN
jgi:hypothetical protein